MYIAYCTVVLLFLFPWHTYKQQCFIVADNKNLSCTNLLDVMKRSDLDFMHDNNTLCMTAKTFDWFDSHVELHLSNLEFLRRVGVKTKADVTLQFFNTRSWM